MRTQHTPGPWKVDPPGKHRIGSGWCVLAPTKEGPGWPTPSATGFYHMAEPPPHGYHNKTEQEANARLIAAAPELLAALKNLLGDLPSIQETDDPQAAFFRCVHCAREYSACSDDGDLAHCADDCPGEIARAAIAKATVTP